MPPTLPELAGAAAEGPPRAPRPLGPLMSLLDVELPVALDTGEALHPPHLDVGQRLVRTMSAARMQAQDFLAKNQGTDGWWGYYPGTPGMTEPTVAVLLALRDDGAQGDARQRAIDALAAAQHPDGGWGLGPHDSWSQWHTSWAILGLASLAPGHPAIQAGIEWLLKTAGIVVTDPEDRAAIERLLDIDPTIRGWPWGPEQASWVEPTSLAMMALRAARADAQHPRVTEGVRYLLDRRCVPGGWNVGNPDMFDQPLEPRTHPTAWALLALRPHLPPDHVDIRDSLAVLRRQMEVEQGAMTLAWGVLALRAWGEPPAPYDEKLRAQQGADGSWDGNSYITATALLALGPGWPGEDG